MIEQPPQTTDVEYILDLERSVRQLEYDVSDRDATIEIQSQIIAYVRRTVTSVVDAYMDDPIGGMGELVDMLRETEGF